MKTFDKIKIDPSKLTAPQFEKFLRTQMMVTIDRRASLLESGKNLDGKLLKPYSRSYAELKKETGRSETVNLTWSGAMNNSLAPIATTSATRAEINALFGGTHVANTAAGKKSVKNQTSEGGGRAISNAQLAEKLDETRPHIGFGKEDIKRMEERFIAEIERLLPEAIKVE